jgi:DNA-binding winged helix-turn-helix (wHTH) protein
MTWSADTQMARLEIKQESVYNSDRFSTGVLEARRVGRGQPGRISPMCRLFSCRMRGEVAGKEAIVNRLGPWADFPVDYCQEQVRDILGWIRVGESGVVVGMSGAGKSNLLGFLASRPDVVQAHLGEAAANTCFLLLDANRLPTLTGTSFYRAMLQTLHRQRACLPKTLRDDLSALYRGHIDCQDDLLLLGAVQDMHHLFCYEGGKQMVWLMDRFDETCRHLDVQFFNSLRALRDVFKSQLCYMVATRHPLPYLRDPAEIDEFCEILAANTCWVGPLCERDARWVAQRMAERLGVTFDAGDVARILSLSGRLPAFLKVAFTGLANGVLQKGQAAAWDESLLKRPEIERQCRQLWDDMTETQQVVLLRVMAGTPAREIEPEPLAYLERLGLVARDGDRRRLFSPLFEGYVHQMKGLSGGQIRLHPKTRAVWRGEAELPVTLTAKEDLLLSYFLEHTDELCTKDALVRAVWPDEVPLEGVRDDRLAQLVRRLREKIEFDPGEPAYILTVHGQGYRFTQPEG